MALPRSALLVNLTVRLLPHSSLGMLTSYNTSKGPSSSCLSTAKDYARVTWNLTQMLLKRLPDAVDSNPVKMAFGIVKIILQIKEVRQHSSYWPLTDHDVRVWKTISTPSTDGSYRRQSSSACWGKRWLVGTRITRRKGKEWNHLKSTHAVPLGA